MFNKEDFKLNEMKFQVIINSKLGINPLTPFRILNEGKQKKFNKVLNEYIKQLPIDFQPYIDEEFNEIVNDDILNSDFDPSKIDVPNQGEKILLLTEEQKTFLEEERIMNGWEKIRI